jgi:hypothetical protein
MVVGPWRIHCSSEQHEVAVKGPTQGGLALRNKHVPAILALQLRCHADYLC